MMKANNLLLAVLAEEYSKWHSLALKVVGKTDEAEEVVQACACKLGRVATVIPASEIRSYLARTVYNSAIDFKRKQWRDPHEPLSHHRDQWIDPAVLPLESLLETEKEQQRETRLRRALALLDTLPPEQQRAVRFMYLSLEPPALSELAKKEGIPLSTARSRVISGLNRLRRMMEPAQFSASEA